MPGITAKQAKEIADAKFRNLLEAMGVWNKIKQAANKGKYGIEFDVEMSFNDGEAEYLKSIGYQLESFSANVQKKTKCYNIYWK